MTDNNRKEMARCYVDAILYRFIEDNLPSAFKLKALAIISTVHVHAGGYMKPSNLTSGQIAKLVNISDTALLKTVTVLEECNMLFRNQAPGRGNRLVITLNNPSLWVLPKGLEFMEEKSSFVHQKEPEFHEITKESIDFKLDDNIRDYAMQPNWQPIFKKIISYVEGPNDLTATDPSKLFGVMAIIMDNTEKPGSPCRLNQREIGKKITQNDASVGRALKSLEEAGVVKRVWGKGRKIITPILPDPELAPVDCSDAPKEASK